MENNRLFFLTWKTIDFFFLTNTCQKDFILVINLIQELVRCYNQFQGKRADICTGRGEWKEFVGRFTIGFLHGQGGAG